MIESDKEEGDVVYFIKSALGAGDVVVCIHRANYKGTVFIGRRYVLPCPLFPKDLSALIA